MRQQVIFLHILICIIGFCTFGPGTLKASAEVTVDASLSHLSFPQEKAARLTILVTGTSNSADIEMPRVDNVRLQNRGTSSQISVVNGTISSSISHNYLVHALIAGTYTIPPIKVTVAGESYFTKPLTFQVSAAGQPPSGYSGGTEPTAAEIAFIRISEKSADHYPGEIVPITIKAYFTQAYRAEIDSLPTIKGDGVVMAQLQDKPQQTEELVNGRMYHVLTWETSISGIKVGKHPISFFLNASLLIPQKRRSLSPLGNSLFDDPFFGGSSLDSFFGGHQRKPIVSASPEIIFNVMPLPSDNQPENFTGAIGDFDLKVSAAPVDVEIGEPMTLTMEISGSGNFDRVEAPVFPEHPEWKVYSPSSNFSEQNKSYSGTKIFEQAVVARTGAVSEIPQLSFSYFDPRQKRYVTTTSDAIAINLKNTDTPVPGSSPIHPAQPLSPPQQQADTQAAAAPTIVGLAPLHLETGTFHDRILPLFKSRWLIAISALCILLLLALFVLKLRQQNIEKHPEIELQRRKKHLLGNDLKLVEQAQAAGNSTSFLTLSRTAIQNQLGLLWNIEPAALSLADIRSRLKPESPLIAIFQAAEEAAYGGATLTDEKMQDYFITLKTELEDLL